ncbi:TetR/AcrR family transcriptional regulator [Dactylosporangium sp. NPDC051541]|uniref:TetR/AcrR family transcriptional regulator n=1 Tax=Dactylosporangium sp. NPDC051541 TaxID=3363977 RepID=UPI0037B55EB5
MTPAARSLRRDAEANRQRLLDAASELFAERGLDVTLNDIAHHAGVGVGTAYRRFPNKEAVIDAVFEQRLEAVEAAAHEALQVPDAWQGLAQYLQRTLRLQLADRGLDQILNDRTLGDVRINDVRVRIAPLVVALVDRAKEHGAVRRDFAPTDVAFIQTAMSAVMERTRDLAPTLYERYLTMMLDGVRGDRPDPTPLPAHALNSETTHLAMTQKRRTGTTR